MAVTQDALFDGEFLKKLEYHRIVSKRMFGGHSKADRRTRQLGAGLEFADHRAYAPGDDFRRVYSAGFWLPRAECRGCW